ncbi:MAG: AAA family ATPase, partial [Candidatus Eisenbacteria bacterium]|nr:AAA family ATPase [Candidatus Eisenbacteria bacterium]
MRPRTLDEYVGQSHILAPGKLLRRAVEADRLFSMVLYGPPGSGKTSLSEVMARATGSALVTMNAVEAGVADLRRTIAEARNRRPKRTILFLDEVHRFNKSQQDVLLGPLEDDTVTMVGATVENPFFYLNPALLSRIQVFELRALEEAEVRALIEAALR